MKIRSTTPFLLFLALCLILASALPCDAARFRVHGPGTTLDSRVQIEVHSFYESTPLRGYAPVRVTISNHSGRERSWGFNFRSGQDFDSGNSLHYETSLTVPHGEARRFDVMVPVARINGYGQLTATVHGHGIVPAERRLYFQQRPLHFGLGRSSPAIAMSPGLWNANSGRLDDSGGSHGVGRINGSAFDPALMTPDWRGYAGLDALWISDTDWLSTGAAERLAVTDWVATGGRLYICREHGETSPLPGLPNLAERSSVHGFGSFHTWPRTGDDVAIEETRVEIFSRNLSSHNQMAEAYRRSAWGLLAQLPEIRVRQLPFIAFLVLFAVVVGPVNLFLFARGHRRYRLFWTTPAIAFGTSLAMFLLILGQDGVGGEGHRFAVWHHFPDEHKAVFLQEQAIRTALLTNREFAIDTPVELSILSLTNQPNQGLGLRAARNSYRGDWFRNRSIQAHLVTGVSATRWRIESVQPSTPDAPPEILSTFPFPIDSLFYRDPGGRIWQTADLPTGTPVRLIPSDTKALDEAWARINDSVGPIADRRIDPLRGKRGYFFAFTAGHADNTVATLDSIRWKSQTVVHTGPLARANP